MHGQHSFTFYAQSFTHIYVDVNHRNGKDNSDANYVKKKDDPEKNKWHLKFLAWILATLALEKWVNHKKTTFINFNFKFHLLLYQLFCF